MTKRLRLTFIAGALLFLWIASAPPREARADDAGLSLTYRAIFHAYQVRLLTDRDADGARIDQFRNVDPLYMTLDIGGYSLGPSAAIDAIASVRFKTDFGSGFNRDTPNGTTDPPSVAGATEFDIVMLYADWKDVTSGLDLRIGRQLILDDLDWYPLDGIRGSMRVIDTSSTALTIEAYAGSPVRLDFLFESDALIGDGFEVSDGPGIAFGGSARLRLLGDLQLHAAYRQELTIRKSDIAVFRQTATDPAQVAEVQAIQDASGGTLGLQEMLLAAGVGYTVRPADLDLYAQLTWNLVFGKLDMARIGAGYNPRPDLHLGLEYLQVYPRFAADSIFNIFNLFPYSRARAEADLELLRGLHISAGYFALLFNGGPKGPLQPSGADNGMEYKGSDVSHGPSASISYQLDDLTFGFDADIATNTGGQYAFGGNYRRFELYGDAAFVERRFGATLRFGALTIQNDWVNDADDGVVTDPETMLSIDIGGRAELLSWLFARVNLVKNFSSYLEGDFRVLSVLEVRYQ